MPPAILDRDEMVRFLDFRRHDAGRTGVPDRRVHRELERESPPRKIDEAGLAGGPASIGRASKLGCGDVARLLRHGGHAAQSRGSAMAASTTEITRLWFAGRPIKRGPRPVLRKRHRSRTIDR